MQPTTPDQPQPQQEKPTPAVPSQPQRVERFGGVPQQEPTPPPPAQPRPTPQAPPAQQRPAPQQRPEPVVRPQPKPEPAARPTPAPEDKEGRTKEAIERFRKEVSEINDDKKSSKTTAVQPATKNEVSATALIEQLEREKHNPPDGGDYDKGWDEAITKAQAAIRSTILR